MAGYCFHGLAIRTDAAHGADPVDALLGPFRDDTADPAALVVALEATPALPAAAGSPGATPSFVHGDVSVSRDVAGEAVRVESPRASLVVAPGGSRIDGLFVSPIDADALDALAHVELFLALVAALHLRGLFHLHAAAIVAPSGEPVLVAGTGGCGKSTLATALVAGGFTYLGDDVVFAARVGRGVRLLGFPRAFHLAHRSVQAVPAVVPHLAVRGRTAAGKRRLDAAKAFPGAARAEAGAPAVLLFPEIVDAAVTRAEPLAPADALARLLASSLFATTRLGSPAQRALLADVVGGARAWAVLLGRDLLVDAAATAGAVASLVQGGRSRWRR